MINVDIGTSDDGVLPRSVLHHINKHSSLKNIDRTYIQNETRWKTLEEEIEMNVHISFKIRIDINKTTILFFSKSFSEREKKSTFTYKRYSRQSQDKRRNSFSRKTTRP